MKGLVYGGPGERTWTDIPARTGPPGRGHPHRRRHHLRHRPAHPRRRRSRSDPRTGAGPRGRRHRRRGRRRSQWADRGRPGVLASCISACGVCRYCRTGSYGQCLGGGGWILGHLVDGVQSQYAWIPFADLSTYKLPDRGTCGSVLMTPRRLGPTSRMPCARTSRTRSRWRCRPAGPSSPKPELSRTTACTPAAPASASTVVTWSAGPRGPAGRPAWAGGGSSGSQGCRRQRHRSGRPRRGGR
jgi:hypothetical protein